ncbi:hypothetical protein AB0D04_32555 [Streptomyces sp. NPDC048483]|uniref:hypothetical protein n=1 Tax=Streptomyces sp. NPDC048483 TaxID=3154927 RepID=UPI0034352FC4
MSQLEGIACEFLIRQGIYDEPATWQPPTDIMDDLQLSGCDLRDIDLGILHRLIRDECLTTAQAARRLDVSHERRPVRSAGTAGTAGRSARRERGATICRARAALPRDRLACLYLDEYRSLKWIAEHADVDVDAVKVLVREYGMTCVGKATRWRQIDSGLAPQSTGRRTPLPRGRQEDRLLRRDDQLLGPAARYARWPDKG